MVKPTVKLQECLWSLYLHRTLGGSKELNVRESNEEEETPDFRSENGSGCEEI